MRFADAVIIFKERLFKGFVMVFLLLFFTSSNLSLSSFHTDGNFENYRIYF